MTNFDERLDRSIDGMLRKEPTAVPGPGEATEVDAELLADLAVAAALSGAIHSQVRPEAKERGRQRLLAELRALEAIPRGFGVPWLAGLGAHPLRGLAIAFVLLVVAGLGTGTMANASGDALPGEFLYPLKQAGEELTLKLEPSTAGQALLHIRYAERRATETAALMVEGKTEAALQGASGFEHHLKAAARLAGSFRNAGETTAVAEQVERVASRALENMEAAAVSAPSQAREGARSLLSISSSATKAALELLPSVAGTGSQPLSATPTVAIREPKETPDAGLGNREGEAGPTRSGESQARPEREGGAPARDDRQREAATGGGIAATPARPPAQPTARPQAQPTARPNTDVDERPEADAASGEAPRPAATAISPEPSGGPSSPSGPKGEAPAAVPPAQAEPRERPVPNAPIAEPRPSVSPEPQPNQPDAGLTPSSTPEPSGNQPRPAATPEPRATPKPAATPDATPEPRATPTPAAAPPPDDKKAGPGQEPKASPPAENRPSPGPGSSSGPPPQPPGNPPSPNEDDTGEHGQGNRRADTPRDQQPTPAPKAASPPAPGGEPPRNTPPRNEQPSQPRGGNNSPGAAPKDRGGNPHSAQRSEGPSKGIR